MTELPTGWETVHLQDFAEVNPGRIDGISPTTVVSFVPMIAVSDTRGEIVGSTVRPFAEVSKGYTQFRERDVIFAKITPCMENGKIAVARSLQNGVACGSTEFHVVRPLDTVSPDYLWRYLRQQRFRDAAESSMTGAVGQRRVPATYLKESLVPLPPLPEQRRIVAKIDGLTARSRRARDHLDHIPRLVEKYKQAVLAAAFRGDLTREWRRHRSLPDPRSSTIADLLVEPIRNGLSVRGSDTPPGIRSLRLSALRGGSVDLSDVRYLPIDERRAERFLLRAEDVLISRGNGTKSFVGLAALVGDVRSPTIFPDTAFRLRFDVSIVDPKWIARIWNAQPMRQQIENSARTTAGIWKIAQSDLNRLEFPLPTMVEQSEIVRRVETAFAWIDRLASEATSARKLVDHLDQAILAKAFRGELVPQDPADEPASVLLERIRAERHEAPKSKSRPRRRPA